MLSIYQERERKLSVGLKSSFGYDYNGSNISMFQNEKEGEINMKKEIKNMECVFFCDNEEKARIRSNDFNSNSEVKNLVEKISNSLVNEYGNLFMVVKDERDSFDGDLYRNSLIGFVAGKHFNEQLESLFGISYLDFIDFANGDLSIARKIASQIEDKDDFDEFLKSSNNLYLISTIIGKFKFSERGLSNMKTRESMIEEMKKEANKNIEVIISVNGKEKLRVTGEELDNGVDFNNFVLDGITSDDRIFVEFKDRRDSEGLIAKNQFVGLLIGKHLEESCKKIYNITIDEFLDFMNCDIDAYKKVKKNITDENTEKVEELFEELKKVINYYGHIEICGYVK